MLKSIKTTDGLWFLTFKILVDYIDNVLIFPTAAFVELHKTLNFCFLGLIAYLIN